MKRNEKCYGLSQCTVTSRLFDTGRKGYRLSDITQVHLRRTFFFLLLPFLMGLLSMVFFYSELLYGDEIFWCVMIVAILGSTSFSIGTIYLEGFNVSGMATLGLYWDMQKLRVDLLSAISKPSRRSRRHLS